MVGAISAVNPPTQLSIQTSNGYTTNGDGSRVPSYNDAVVVPGDVQALSAGDIQHLDSLNIQGRAMKFYINGNIDGIIRVFVQGGDLITIVAGGNNPQLLATIWLVKEVAEYWPDWCCVYAQLQDQIDP